MRWPSASSRSQREDVLDYLQARLKRMPEAMLIRRHSVERSVGAILAWMGGTHVLMKTLEKVRTEMSLHVLAYNLKRMITMLGVRPRLRALAACTLLPPRTTPKQRSS